MPLENPFDHGIDRVVDEAGVALGSSVHQRRCLRRAFRDKFRNFDERYSAGRCCWDRVSPLEAKQVDARAFHRQNWCWRPHRWSLDLERR